jgi:hypothetical protein
MILFTDGEGLVISILLMAVAAIFFGPPIVGYFMIQSYVDNTTGKTVPASNPKLGWFLLIGYPIIIILLCIAIWWYNKKTNTSMTQPLLD